jgi:amino acid transporter
VSAGLAGSTAADSGTEPGLIRAIGTRDLAANIINLVVGAGIFVLPALVFAEIGAASFLAYLVCAVAVGLVFLCFAEIGSRVTTSGGAYAYVEAAFGPFAGFLTSTLLWFAYAVMSDAAIANVLYESLASAVPGLAGPLIRVAFMLVIFSGLAAINIRGVRHGARFVFALTVIKLVPLLLLVLVGFSQVEGEHLLVDGSWPSVERLGAASLLLFFAFGGAESALTPSGEIVRPAKTVPRALLLGVGGVFVIYLALQIVAQGVLGPSLAAHPDTPLAATADHILRGAGLLLIAGVSISIFGTLSGDLLASPRAIYAAAENGHLPAFLAAVHPRHRTPHVAILVFAALTCGLAISGAFEFLAVASSAALLFIYLGCSLAVFRLRRRDVRASDKVFRAPGGPVVPVASCLIIVWLLSHVTAAEAAVLGGILVASALYYVVRRKSLTGSPDGAD